MPPIENQDGEFEYTFPDEESGNKGSKLVKVEDAKPAEKPGKDGGDEGKPEIQVVDDTPKRDRGRKPAKEAPAEVTDEELAEYSEAVQKRIKQFTRGYHDERRRAEAAEREREEAVRFAQHLSEQYKQAQDMLSQGEKVFLEQAKKATEAEINVATRAYKDAYEAGDADALAKAQQLLTSAQVTLDRINNYRPAPVQNKETEVYTPQPTQKPSVPKPDDRALSWQDDNPWFGDDEEMTSFALGVHEKLVKDGVDPRSKEYYERVDARMRKVFPDYFGEPESDPPPQKRAASPVAPATRSTGPKKIRLTQTQVSLAKRMGIPLEEYAKQVAKLENR
jgi:hypothetical protein